MAVNPRGAELPEGSAPTLSVVAPLYLNAETLEELVERVRRSLDGLNWELILVDDASPDGSGARAETLAAADARLMVVRLSENGGQNEALRQGVRRSRGRQVAFIDADLQDPPEILRELVAASAGCELVFGIRQGPYQSWPRRLSSWLYKALRSRLCRVPAGAGLLLVGDGELLRAVAREAPRPCWWIPQLGARRPRIGAIAVERRRRPRGVSAYRGLMRFKVALPELWQALRLRWGGEQR